jgi:hypothetical protein
MHEVSKLRIRSVFTKLDLSMVPCRSHRSLSPSLFLQEEVEFLEPRVPKELFHLDLEAMLLNYEMWYRWEKENPEDGELLTLNIGSVSSTIRCPTNPKTPICYVCRRSLDLFTFSLKDVHGLPRGFCPLHVWENGVRKEYPSAVSEAKRNNQKPPTEDSYLAARRSSTVRQWNREDALWWENQKALSTPRYLSWLERQKDAQGILLSQPSL